jgi:drug/metabolite transporter (DMT)-like permease
MQQYIGEIAAIGVAICWTASALFFEKAGKYIGSLSVNIIRIGLAIVLLGLMTWVGRGKFFADDATGEQWFWLLLSGVVGFFLGDMCLFHSYSIIGARMAALIMTLTPVITSVFGYLFLHENLSLLKTLGIATVVAGILIAMLGRKDEKLRFDVPFKGFLLAFGGALGQAFGLLLSKHGMGDYNAIAATQIRAIGGLACFVVLFTLLGRWRQLRLSIQKGEGMRDVTFGTVFGLVIGVSLSLYAVQHANTGVAATLMGLVPIFIILPSVIFFKQKVTAVQILGTFVSVGGCVLLFV